MKHALTLRILLIALAALMLTATLVSCGAAPNDMAADMNTAGGAFETGSNTAQADRKIIKTVHQYIETQQYDSYIDSVAARVESVGGYISSSSYEGAGTKDMGRREARFVIRVPAERLYELTDSLGERGSVVSYEEDQSDVTLAYVDVVSRIEVMQTERKALLALLEKADNTNDVLAIRQSIEKIQEELASLEAQKKVYDDQVAYSTVHLYVDEVERELPESGRSFFGKVGLTFVKSLRGVWRIILAVVFAVLAGSPYLIFFGLIIWGLVAFVRYNNRRVEKKLALAKQKEAEKKNQPKE